MNSIPLQLPFPYSPKLQRCQGLHISNRINEVLVNLGIVKDREFTEANYKLFEIGYAWEKVVEAELQRFGVCRIGEIACRQSLELFVCPHCGYSSTYLAAHYDAKEELNVHQCPLCMGVVVVDELLVYASPDGVQHQFKLLWEYKATSKSSNKHPMEDHRWRMQVLAYLAILGYNKVNHWDFHMFGDYSRPWHVEDKPYCIEFTNEEIDNNWKLLFNERN